MHCVPTIWWCTTVHIHTLMILEYIIYLLIFIFSFPYSRHNNNYYYLSMLFVLCPSCSLCIASPSFVPLLLFSFSLHIIYSSFVFLHYAITAKLSFLQLRAVLCTVLGCHRIYSGVFIYLLIFIYLVSSASNRNFIFVYYHLYIKCGCVNTDALTHFVQVKIFTYQNKWHLSSTFWPLCIVN